MNYLRTKWQPLTSILTFIFAGLFVTEAQAQFGLGVLGNGRNGASSQSMLGGSSPRTGTFPQRTVPNIAMPTMGPRMNSNSGLGPAVGRAVVSSAVNAINQNFATLRGAVARPSQPSNPACCPAGSTTPNYPVAGPVIVAGVPNTSGTIYHSGTAPVIIAQTPVTRQDTVVSGPEQSSNQSELEQLRTIIANSKQLFRQTRYMEAAHQLEEAITLSPEDSDILQFRGLNHFASGEFESAAADVYDSLLYGNTWNWPAVYDLYQSKERYETQLRILEQTTRQSPSLSSHFLLAYHYIVLDHLDRSKKELESALALQPEEPVLTKLVAAVSQRLESMEK